MSGYIVEVSDIEEALMRNWLMEVYPDEEEEILEADFRAILRAIDHYYDGGIRQFIKDGMNDNQSSSIKDNVQG